MIYVDEEIREVSSERSIDVKDSRGTPVCGGDRSGLSAS